MPQILRKYFCLTIFLSLALSFYGCTQEERNQDNPAATTQSTLCGNFALNPGEQCDDGNRDDGVCIEN